MSSYKILNVHIRGITPTILHNGRMANPLDEFAKAMKLITSSRPRGGVLSDEQAEELARLEFMGAMYVDDNGVPCWPGENVEAMLLAAAKKFKEGPKAKIGLLVDDNATLIYDGPKTVEALWAIPQYRFMKMARINGTPVLRCRPIFHAWETKFRVHFDPEKIDESTVEKWLGMAGTDIGLSDWRPKFGRFEVMGVK